MTNVKAIAAGDTHSLALRNDGVVIGWGLMGTLPSRPPVGLANVTAIAAGMYFSLALTGDGRVVGWGGNAYGQVTVPPLTDPVAIAAGGFHSLALKRDGTVVGWGYQNALPSGWTNVKAISAGRQHSLALKTDGTIVAAGNNGFGQGRIPSGLTGATFTAVAAGHWHNLALKSDGTVVAWGRNDDGQTSIPSTLTNVVAIAAGEKHSLALKADGTVVAWGNNASVPTALTNVKAITAGTAHTLAIVDDATPPALYLPDGITAEATSAAGAEVDYAATAKDFVDPSPVVSCDHSSGSGFPLGATTVTCTATDSSNNATTGSFTVTVQDTTAPTLHLPEDLSVAATSASGAAVEYAVTADDAVDPQPRVDCVLASGENFALGANPVSCTATDAAGNIAVGVFTVTVTFPWSGYLQPLNVDGSSAFKAGRTVPVKFALAGASAPIADAAATLTYAKLSDVAHGADLEAETNVAATTGNQFRYSDGQYIVNWSTAGLAAGTYLLKIDLRDGVDRHVLVSLTAR